ncbi:unnamed protein product [Nyctereutes procyonoides]|uniref:(raccoon dog) hypothetical protein n=1 Tax=Nyctereutes procyonoides TaxID=34880 RepID=A0A811Y9B8_NYCPR|nr:unnamed protein product [Nyctereutes procyonoides]
MGREENLLTLLVGMQAGARLEVGFCFPLQSPHPFWCLSPPSWHHRILMLCSLRDGGNIYKTGDVCISILHPPVDDPQSRELPSEWWNPTQNVTTILLSIISLLNEPNTFSLANVDAFVMYRKWKESKGKDREYTDIIRNQVLGTKVDAEWNGVKVPTLLAEYCVKTKAPAPNEGSDLFDDDYYEDGKAVAEAESCFGMTRTTPARRSPDTATPRINLQILPQQAWTVWHRDCRAGGTLPGPWGGGSPFGCRPPFPPVSWVLCFPGAACLAPSLGAHQLQLFFFSLSFFKILFIYLTHTEREHKWESSRQKEREKQAPRWAGSPKRGYIPGPWDHDLPKVKSVSHPGTPEILFIMENVC